MSTFPDSSKKSTDVLPLEYNKYSMETYPPDCTVITNQPNTEYSGGDNLKAVINEIPTGYPSLDYLSMVDQLIVHQKVELLEALCGCETQNKYKIKNSMGQEVYKAIEDTDCCTRFCLGPIRPFDMNILDNNDMEMMHLYRPYRCANCCCPCCLQRMDIYAPPGNLIGVVIQEWSILRPKLSVLTPDERVLFRISGPLCQISCFFDLDFPIYDEESGEQIGKITKQWSGLGRELFTDADHFGITFPMGLEVSKKAALIGALFLIDFMYFEKPKRPVLLEFLQ